MQFTVTRIILSLLLSVSLIQQSHAEELNNPSRHAQSVLPQLQKFDPAVGFPQIERILGKPYKDVGSGIYIFIYNLDDSTTITVGAVLPKEVFYIRRSGKGLDAEQLIFEKHRSIEQRGAAGKQQTP